MIGWIIVGLMVVGAALFFYSIAGADGTAEERMGGAFFGLTGTALFGLGLLLLIGATIFALM